MAQTYACRKCRRTYSYEEYEKSRFCRVCETYLMAESKVVKSSRCPRRIRKIEERRIKREGYTHARTPQNYEIRKEQMKFVEEATRALRNKEVFLGSAPCGIGKSLASLLTVLPQLEENKLMVCFRTRTQLHIYLKELRALSQDFSAVSFFSKQDMCPQRIKGNLSYFDFFEECKRLKDNCESAIKPYCKFYWNNIKSKGKAETLALDCTRKILAPGRSVEFMSKRGFCAYEALKRILRQVNVFLGTYHYIFDPRIRKTLLKSFGTDLSGIYLIVDEAHNLPTFARELLSDKLSRYTLERASGETEEFTHESSASVQEYLDTLLEQVFQHAQQTLKSNELRQINPKEVNDLFLDRSGVSGLNAAGTLQEYGEFVKAERLQSGSDSILSFNHRVGIFLEKFFENNGTEHIQLATKDKKNRVALEVRSFDGRELTDPVLRQVRGSIMMSGFLSPPRTYRDLALYESDNVCLREFGSPFPPENRLILVAEDVSSEFKRRTTEMLGKWRDYIELISTTNQGNVAVFFTSYGLMHRVLPLIETDRKIIVEQQKMKRSIVVNKLVEYSDNMLFGVMGGKFSEGIDYPRNVLKCVVAVGLPYATWNVYQKALIKYLEIQFPQNGRTYAYLAPAIHRLVQTCGRVHRSASDKGAIVILDGRIALSNMRHYLPTYFQNEMKIVTNPTECAEKIRHFWLAASTRKRVCKPSEPLYLGEVRG